MKCKERVYAGVFNWCTRNIKEGKEWCWQHDPIKKQERRDAAYDKELQRRIETDQSASSIHLSMQSLFSDFSPAMVAKVEAVIAAKSKYDRVRPVYQSEGYALLGAYFVQEARKLK